MTQIEYEDADSELEEQGMVLTTSIKEKADALMLEKDLKNHLALDAELTELLQRDSLLTERRVELHRQYSAQTDEQKNPLPQDGTK